MKRCLALVLAILGPGCALHGQVTDTTVCDVVRNPAQFDGKMARIKGTVVAGFDEFVIKDAADPNCGYMVNTIWLSYPQGTRGKAGPVAMVQLQPARNFTGKYSTPRRTPVMLDKNKDFKQFDSLLAQTHQKGADLCLGCTRYEVTATLVGRLDAVAEPTLKRDSVGRIVSFGGFGNMNAYPARLVLQSVSDVTPKEIDYSKNDDATKGGNLQAPIGGTDPYNLLGSVRRVMSAIPECPARDAALNAVAAYGEEGKHNGVLIEFGTMNEAAVKDEALGTKDSPDEVLFNSTFNQDRLQGIALALALVHIGDHIAEIRNPSPGQADAPPYLREWDAWAVTTRTAGEIGQRFLTLPGGYLVWSANWPADALNDKIDVALRNYLANEALLSQ